MAKSTTTTTKGNFLQGFAQGAQRGLNIAQTVQNMQLKKEEAAQNAELNSLRMKEAEVQLIATSYTGIGKLTSDIVTSEDPKAALDLLYPQYAKLQENMGIKPVDKETLAKRFKAGGEQYANDMASSQKMYGIMTNWRNMTPSQIDAASKDITDSLNRLSTNPLLTKEERDAHKKAKEVLSKQLTQIETFRSNEREGQLDRENRLEIAKIKAASKGKASKKDAAGYSPEKVARLDRAFSLLEKVSTGPVKGSKIAGILRKALGDKEFELLETTLNDIGLDRIAAFAAEAGARSIDSEGERKFIESVIPGVNKTKETNQALLLVAKGQQLQQQMIDNGQSIDGTAKFYKPGTSQVVIAKPGEEPKGYVAVSSLYGSVGKKEPAAQKSGPVDIGGIKLNIK